MCSENVWCVNFHRDAKSRVRYQNKFNAEAAASILDGNKLGKHPLVVVPYENLTTGLVEVGPGASEDSIEGALAGSLWWKPVVDSDGTRSAYILARYRIQLGSLFSCWLLWWAWVRALLMPLLLVVSVPACFQTRSNCPQLKRRRCYDICT